MLELLNEERYCLSSFCKEKIDVTPWSCIEGKMGRAWVDKKENPKIAMVVVADLYYFTLKFMEDSCSNYSSLESFEN